MGFSQILNTGMVVVIIYGLSQRRRPKRHIPAMLLAFVGDLTNVLVIQLSRGAIQQIPQMTPYELFHVSVSVLSVVCYVIALVTGWKLLKTGQKRKIHRVNAIVFVVTRALSYFTSFGMS